MNISIDYDILNVIVIRYFMILDWLLVADKTECAGSETKKKDVSTADECSKICKSQSSMFAFGTNDYGTERCSSTGCTCLCETAASMDGTCSQTSHNGYRLYKYKTGGKTSFVNFIYITLHARIFGTIP